MPQRFILSLIFLAYSSHTLAWGPATHAYIAISVTGSQEAELLYASMLPDCSSLMMMNPRQKARFNHLTHFEPERLTPSPFATGFMTHNGAWGADYYAHLYYDAGAEDIWSTTKYRQFSTEFAVSMQKAEDVIEMCMDIQVRLLMGPSFGALIASAAEACGKAQEQAMVEAFAAPLAEQVEDLTLEAAERDILFAVRSHRMATMSFGRQLGKSQAEIFEAIPAVLAFYFGCDQETAAGYFKHGMELTSDFKTEIDRICAKLKERMPRSAPESM